MTDWQITFDSSSSSHVRLVITPEPDEHQLDEVWDVLSRLPAIDEFYKLHGAQCDLVRTHQEGVPDITNEEIRSIVLGILNKDTERPAMSMKVVPQKPTPDGNWIIQTDQRHTDKVLLYKLERAGLGSLDYDARGFNILCKSDKPPSEIQQIAEEVIAALRGPLVPLETVISLETGMPNEFKIKTNRFFNKKEQEDLEFKLISNDELGLIAISFVGVHHDLLCKVANDFFDRQHVAERVVHTIVDMFGDKTH